MFTLYLTQDGTKEEKSDKDSASKDGKVDKPDGKPPAKDTPKEKGAKDAKEKGMAAIERRILYLYI